jgi:hypothetical protein
MPQHHSKGEAMTKVIMNIDPISSSIMYDCLNHSSDYDTCTIISTLTNVLVETATRLCHPPSIYEKGHVRIDMPYSEKAAWMFETVFAVIQQAAEQNPEHIRIY